MTSEEHQDAPVHLRSVGQKVLSTEGFFIKASVFITLQDTKNNKQTSVLQNIRFHQYYNSAVA